ncbi:MAG: isoleucine--tRNA ligase [Alphaproteobacteria bacterium]|nr:isoleucine--tRNA ligase [Alphaproteobacteria bacterium]
MTQDYRPTIFLPKTDFPMKGDLPIREPELLKRWEEMDLYGLMMERAKDRELFILHDGPPFANGHIHLGHALNKILKDVVNKSQYKLGKLTPYVPGWDCHGLPIEAKIEEKYRQKGIQKEDIPLLQFRQECRDFANSWIDVQRDDFKRLGVTAEWDNPYTTMSPDAEAEIVRLIGIFLLNGSLYRGVKPVMWSVVEKTALAEMEIEYMDHESFSLYVRFPITESPLPSLKGANAVIWTTTAWTLPGNRALAYGVDLDYIALRVEEKKEGSLAVVGEVLLIAEGLRETFEEEIGITTSTVLETLKGSDLKGTHSHHPFHGEGYDFDVPLLPGEHVTLEAGTGLVHTAPGHGVEDFAVGKAFNLEIPETVAEDGLYYTHVPLFAGKHVYKVGPEIIEKLEKKGVLLKQAKLVHSYPHSWRSKKPLIFRTTPQWFIDLEKEDLRKKSLEAVDTVQWIPTISKHRIQSMVENRPADWGLSRQRPWGVPLPLFVHKATGDVLRDHAVMGRIVKAFKEHGSDIWYSGDPSLFLGESYKSSDYEQVQDIIDVWFESGATQSFVLRERPDLRWPADLYLEGSDQHRGWFQSSLLVSCGTGHGAPYKQVMTCGFIVDENGRKMSKSRGDAVSPQTITSTLGADLLRLWVVGSDYYEDLRVGPEILKRQQDIYRRYRNTLRYLLGALAEFSEDEKIDYDQMPELEKWLLHRLYELDQKVRDASQAYEFQALYSEIHNFCSGDLSAFYFDMRKDSLYCDDPKDSKRRATRTLMDITFDCLVKWLSPVLCFTAEEAWLSRYPQSQGSVHLETFPELPFKWNALELGRKYDGLRAIRKLMTGALEVARASKVFGSSLQAKVTLFIDSSHKVFIQNVDLAELSITSDVEVIEGPVPEGAFMLDETPNMGVRVTLASGNKCNRCWRVLPEVGTVEITPDLCCRCGTVVERMDKK